MSAATMESGAVPQIARFTRSIFIGPRGCPWIEKDRRPFSEEAVAQTAPETIIMEMGMPILLWLLGVPIPIILILLLVWH